jgi:hypothetical protein
MTLISSTISSWRNGCARPEISPADPNT